MNTFRETFRNPPGSTMSFRPRVFAWPFVMLAWVASPAQAHASLFHGETLDAIANGISWVAIILAPIIGIVAFWLVHILPEKIAEKKKHPQTRAIQCMCLLSLVFGGLLWPFAWLWAYSKPVLYKAAYGTDVDETVGHGHGKKEEKEEDKKKGGQA
ncbi:uncharacterized protein DUF3302 [Roseimicrobium gellanilyticum]|uniref:Uncharacterized protein DUF3302 n=2 Tax=Roseimicrobium gellanilyticum TaxID=748857 RepID=A0A366HA81_9BACT|nr:uncharacterized protein DUF3302 [Roseimicrobium gellanilyticum]